MIQSFGYWKNEGEFTKAKFIRQKCYLEQFWKDRKFKGKIKKTKISRNRKIKGFKDFHITKITCAGLPESCYKYVDWKNFKEGFTCGGKLTYKQVKGRSKTCRNRFYN